MVGVILAIYFVPIMLPSLNTSPSPSNGFYARLELGGGRSQIALKCSS